MYAFRALAFVGMHIIHQLGCCVKFGGRRCASRLRWGVGSGLHWSSVAVVARVAGLAGGGHEVQGRGRSREWAALAVCGLPWHVCCVARVST